MRKVAITGFAGTRDQAPIEDLSVEWWGLNELYGHFKERCAKAGRPPFDVWFELHDMQTITDSEPDAAHLKWLQAQPAGRPIFMQDVHADIPASVKYPLEDMIRIFGHRYFTSSISYMLALAIAAGRNPANLREVVDPGAAYGWIGVFGIDLASDSEYADQRASTEWLVGYAQGVGIEIYIPKEAALLKADRLYGFEPGLGDGPVGEAYDRKRLRDLAAQHKDALAAVHTIEGAMQEAENRLTLRRHLKRGVVIPGYSSLDGGSMIPAKRTSDGRVVS